MNSSYDGVGLLDTWPSSNGTGPMVGVGAAAGAKTTLGGWECGRLRAGSGGAFSVGVVPAQDALKHRSALRVAFLLHAYGFACLFSILAFYTFFSILNLRSLISRRPFMSSINGFLCLLGASRASYLFIDPYNMRQSVPRIAGAILWELAFPCLSSAFCLLQLAFLQLTQLKLGPEKLRQKSCPSLVIAAHFSFILGVNIILGFHDHLMPIKYLGQSVVLCWGASLFGVFLYVGRQVRRLLDRVPRGVLMQTDLNSKGIMQLAMLAPYNNLASSVAAALVPTLLAPKFHVSTTRKKEQHPSASRTSSSGDTPANKDSLKRGSCGSGGSGGSKGPEKGSGGSTESPPVIQPPTIMARRDSPPAMVLRPPTPTILVSPGSRRGSIASRRGSGLGLEGGGVGSRRSSACSILGEDIDRLGTCRRASQTSLLRRTSDCPSIAEESPGAPGVPPSSLAPPGSPGGGGPPRKKSLTWKGSDDVCTDQQMPVSSPHTSPHKSQSSDQDDDSATPETRLLGRTDSGSGSVKGGNTGSSSTEDHLKDDDVTLHSILNHIAYVNRGGSASGCGESSSGSNRRRQLRSVIDLASATAIMGLILCVAELFQLYGPFGMLVGVCDEARDRAPKAASAMSNSPGALWPWFAYQTLCRALELAMGCAMASITKQPVAGRTPYLHRHHIGLKRDSLYL